MRRLLLLAALCPIACSKPAEAPPPPPPEPTSEPITFQSKPVGAHVTLDGQALPKPTPFTQDVAVGGGHHVARFQLDGYEPEQVEFLVGLAPYTAEVQLREAPKVAVTTEPTGASVDLDGKLAIPTTPGQLALTAGEHDVLVRLAGYVPVKKHLKATDRSPLKLKLDRSAAVSVSSQPAGAKIFVDGADSGRVTPAEDLMLAAGKPHRIWVEQGKLRSEPKPVKALKPGQTLKVELKLADLGTKALQARKRALQAEIARLEVEQRRYEKKTAGFMVSDARAERNDEHHLSDIEDQLEALQAELADLEDQLGQQ